MSHPSLGLPPADQRIVHPDAARHVLEGASRLAARALEVAIKGPFSFVAEALYSRVDYTHTLSASSATVVAYMDVGLRAVYVLPSRPSLASVGNSLPSETKSRRRHVGCRRS